MVFNKLNYVYCLYLSQGNGFCPLREIIGYSKYKLTSFRGQWSDRSNDIHALCLEWPSDGNWMKMLRCAVNEYGMHLERMIMICIYFCVCQYHRPVEAIFFI